MISEELDLTMLPLQNNVYISSSLALTMLGTALTIVLASGCALLDEVNGGNPSDDDAPKSSMTGPKTFCPAGTFVGDIQGIEATARVQWTEQTSYDPSSPVPNETYTLVGGEIQSGPYYYTFKADLYGMSGFGDMVDHTDNSQFRIRVDVGDQGFVLTVNPFADAIQYSFACAP